MVTHISTPSLERLLGIVSCLIRAVLAELRVCAECWPQEVTPDIRRLPQGVMVNELYTLAPYA